MHFTCASMIIFIAVKYAVYPLITDHTEIHVTFPVQHLP